MSTFDVPPPRSILAQIGDALSELYLDAEKERVWLRTPNPHLGGERPERVKCGGDGARVLEVLQGLIQGVYL